MQFDAFLLDASGVLYNNGVPYPGIPETVQRLQKTGAVYLATNNTSASPSQIHQYLRTIGISIPVSHILSSGLTLTEDPSLYTLVAQKKVFVYGHRSTRYYVYQAGGRCVDTPQEAEVFVLTHATPEAHQDPVLQDMLTQSHTYPDLPVLCINPDRYVVSGKTLYPVVGHVAALFPTVIWAGKPHDNYTLWVIRKTLLNAGITPNRRVVFVDDNPDNVIHMCAILGISGIVVTETGLAAHHPWRETCDTLPEHIQVLGSLADIDQAYV